MMPDCHQVAKDLSAAFNEFREARACHIEAYNQSMLKPDIPGDRFDLEGTYERAKNARECLLQQCDVAINSLHNLGIPAKALAEYYALVSVLLTNKLCRDKPTRIPFVNIHGIAAAKRRENESLKAIVAAWPAAYAEARTGNGQEHESGADGAVSVVGKSRAEKKKIPEKPIIDLPHDVKWKNIRLKFSTNDSVRVFYKNVEKKFAAAELGMVDGRTKEPNREWDLLLEMANNSGAIPPKPYVHSNIAEQVRGTSGPLLKGIQGRDKARQELNKRLKNAFGLSDDAIVKDEKYKGRSTWKAAFLLEPHGF